MSDRNAPQGAILIVEDEPILREELVEMFESRGFSATAAEGADSALHWLRATERPTSVLTDLRMPGASGLDLIRAIRGDAGLAARILVIVLMTGHSDLTDQVDLDLRRHDVRLLAKPIATSALMKVFGLPPLGERIETEAQTC